MRVEPPPGAYRSFMNEQRLRQERSSLVPIIDLPRHDLVPSPGAFPQRTGIAGLGGQGLKCWGVRGRRSCGAQGWETRLRAEGKNRGFSHAEDGEEGGCSLYFTS